MNITLDYEQAEEVVIAFLKDSIRYQEESRLPYEPNDDYLQLMSNLYGVLEYCLPPKDYQEFVKKGGD